MKRDASILCAEADPDFREALMNHLLLAGYSTIHMVPDTQALRHALSTGTFDLIFMDYDLFNDEAVYNDVTRYRQQFTSAVVLLLNRERSQIEAVFQHKAVLLCLLKPSVGPFIMQLVDD